MKRLKAVLYRWLIGEELDAIFHQVVLLRMEMQHHARTCDETNYDRWKENRLTTQIVQRVALKLAMDDIVKAKPEEN